MNLLESIPKEPVNNVVVRLRTTMFSTDKGLTFRQDLIYQKRLSTGFNWIEEDASCAGADLLIKNIVNLRESKDGLYMIVPCNESRDWETGMVDSYDYKLVPFEKPVTGTK